MIGLINIMNKKTSPKLVKEPVSRDKDLHISWEYWIDPYGDNIDNFNPISENEDLNNYDSCEYEKIGEKNEQNFNEQGFITKKPYKLAITQVGVIPFYEHSLPSKIFKFWVGHTNFNISPKIAKVIEDTPGVETLDIFTRYRFRIGVGKIFDSKEVRLNIQNRIKKVLNKQ